MSALRNDIDGLALTLKEQNKLKAQPSMSQDDEERMNCWEREQIALGSRYGLNVVGEDLLNKLVMFELQELGKEDEQLLAQINSRAGNPRDSYDKRHAITERVSQLCQILGKSRTDLASLFAQLSGDQGPLMAVGV